MRIEATRGQPARSTTDGASSGRTTPFVAAMTGCAEQRVSLISAVAPDRFAALHRAVIYTITQHPVLPAGLRGQAANMSRRRVLAKVIVHDLSGRGHCAAIRVT